VQFPEGRESGAIEGQLASYMQFLRVVQNMAAKDLLRHEYIVSGNNARQEVEGQLGMPAQFWGTL